MCTPHVTVSLPVTRARASLRVHWWLLQLVSIIGLTMDSCHVILIMAADYLQCMEFCSFVVRRTLVLDYTIGAMMNKISWQIIPRPCKCKRWQQCSEKSINSHINNNSLPSLSSFNLHRLDCKLEAGMFALVRFPVCGHTIVFEAY